MEASSDKNAAKTGWVASKSSFEAAAAERRGESGKAKDFARKLGLYHVDWAIVAEDAGVVYFVLLEGGFINSDAIAYAPSGKPADWGSIRDCEPFDGPWHQCVH